MLFSGNVEPMQVELSLGILSFSLIFPEREQNGRSVSSYFKTVTALLVAKMMIHSGMSYSRDMETRSCLRDFSRGGTRTVTVGQPCSIPPGVNWEDSGAPRETLQ